MIKNVLAPKGARISDVYSVFIKEDKTWIPVSVYMALTPDGSTNYVPLPLDILKEFNGFDHGTIALKTYFAGFDFSSEVQVKIVYNKEVSFFTFKPLNTDIDFKVNGNEVTFTLNSPKKITIEPNGDMFGALTLFADSIEAEEKRKNMIYFPKGFYTSENCEYISIDEYGNPVIDGIKDDTLIYLDRGAVVNASITLSGVKGVKIAGKGILTLLERCYGADCGFEGKTLYGSFREFARPMVYIKSGCEDIEIDGVTMLSECRLISIRNCSDIKINNVKMFSHAVNGDGINCVNTSGVKITDCFFHTSDDCVCMYTSYDSIAALNDIGYEVKSSVSENYEVSGCILWTIARPFQFSGHGTKETNPRNRVGNVYVHDCIINDVAQDIYGNTREHREYWSGIMRVLSQSEVFVHDIKFENIFVSWTKGFSGKLIHLEIRNNENASYSEGQGYRIENVSFKNIKVINAPEKMMPFFLKAPDMNGDYGIGGITFDNIKINDKPISKNNMLIVGNVSDIKII